jgi:molybdate-binding protein/DNA-binding transcriptional regulator YhcF (GntR family)
MTVNYPIGLSFPSDDYILAGVDDNYLYQKIAEAIKKKIISGELKPGNRLPSVREMAVQWDCTAGTVQRAYQELKRQGLVLSRSGQGTRVTDRIQTAIGASAPLRKAALVHRAESYLLEMLTSGFALHEIEDAMRQAMDRWRIENKESYPRVDDAIRFAGSHDLVITWIASNFANISPGYRLELAYSGSLGGLIALSEGKCDLAGCHLWDVESESFNKPFIRRILPGRRVALVTLARRRLGLFLPPGNQSAVRRLEDLTHEGVKFINRQQGSGTRVWLDHALNELNIETRDIVGYSDEVTTHSAVALKIAEGEANAGVGLEAAAASYGLDFIFLRHDRYDLVIPHENIELRPIRSMIDWLQHESAKTLISGLGGYDVEDTGQLSWIE